MNEQVTKRRFWCTNSSKCPKWICQWIIMCEMRYWNTIKDTCQS